jgi:peptidoglycan/LPS O-acetylase OafA/YrhL
LIRRNSFDFVRFFAASVVLVAHHFYLAGGKIPSAFGEDLAGYALDAFFCLSGFLIFQSLDRSTDWAHFLAARLTRLVPTFLIVLVVVSLATLVWFQNYVNIVQHVKYIYRNFFLISRINSDWIPGVFDGNPHNEINTPLWSLAYEIWLYCALYGIALLPRRLWVTAIILSAVVLNVCWLSFTVNQAVIPFTPIFPMRMGRLGCFFFAGSLISAFWNIVKPNALLWGFLSLILFIALNFAFEPVTFLHAGLFAMAVIGLGSSSALSPFSRGGDPSYGMYVFAWPIQQFTTLTISSFWPSLIVAFLTTVAMGYLTFHLYERRCMDYRKQLASRLRSLVIPISSAGHWKKVALTSSSTTTRETNERPRP